MRSIWPRGGGCSPASSTRTDCSPRRTGPPRTHPRRCGWPSRSVPGARAPVVRPRRSRHGDRLRHARASRTTSTACASRRSSVPVAAARRPVPRRRARDRHRRALRRHELYIGGIMEHIEEAGIRSGDSACTLPPVTLGRDVQTRSSRRPARIAEASGCGGCSTCSSRSGRACSTCSRRTRGVTHGAVRLEGARHPAREGRRRS